MNLSHQDEQFVLVRLAAGLGRKTLSKDEMGLFHNFEPRVLHLTRGHQAFHQEEDGLLSEGLLGVQERRDLQSS